MWGGGPRSCDMRLEMCAVPESGQPGPPQRNDTAQKNNSVMADGDVKPKIEGGSEQLTIKVKEADGNETMFKVRC